MLFKGQNSLTVTKSSWQRIPDDGSCDCESLLREFSHIYSHIYAKEATKRKLCKILSLNC